MTWMMNDVEMSLPRFAGGVRVLGPAGHHPDRLRPRHRVPAPRRPQVTRGTRGTMIHVTR